MLKIDIHMCILDDQRIFRILGDAASEKSTCHLRFTDNALEWLALRSEDYE